MIDVQINSTNPDTDSISNKDIIDIEYTSQDISIVKMSGSLPSDSLQVDNTTNQLILVTQRYDNIPITAGRTYFTPVYTEQIDYERWITTVNKNFFELT